MNLGPLKNRWDLIKDRDPPQEFEWTEEDDRKLQMLENGDVDGVSDTTLFKRAFVRKCNVIRGQALFLTSSVRREIVLSLYESLPSHERVKFNDYKLSIDDGVEFKPTLFSYDGNPVDTDDSLVG